MYYPRNISASNTLLLYVNVDNEIFMCSLLIAPHFSHISRVAQGAYLEIEYIRNVFSVSGTSKYADSGTA